MNAMNAIDAIDAIDATHIREEGEGVWNGMKENSLTDERFSGSLAEAWSAYSSGLTLVGVRR
jgi:hypothetical protein